jgi:hypothetical protein
MTGIRTLKSTLLAASILLGAPLLPGTYGIAAAQTTVLLKNPAPDGTLVGFVLTDGTVLVQGGQASDWWKLTPDNTGSYVHGTWKQVASLPSGYVPLYFASAVLADGRVVIAGGEYNDFQFAFINTCAIYDPLKNSWKEFKAPAKWGFIGDSPSSMLPDGSFLLGSKFDKRVARLDPKTLTWTELNDTGKRDFNAEEGWTLMPNGTILTADVKAAPHAEMYDPAAQEWTSLGSTVTNLQGPPSINKINYGHNRVYYPPGEIGPAILMPDGTVFATGSTHKGATDGHTAIYTPGANGGPGTWKPGPNFTSGDDAGDSFASLTPSGHVLVEAESGNLYLYDGTNLTKTRFADGGPLSGDGLLLVLPTGEIFVGGTEVFRDTGKPNPAWAPTITSVPTELSPGSTYKITGTQFNGLSQANDFGDEMQTATNYPLVRITNTASGHVVYARTHDHSTMAVATGSTPVSTKFDVPSTIETGPSTLEVVANGIPSAPAKVTVQ